MLMLSEAWPLDGVKFETLKEQLAKRKPEDLEVDYGILLHLSNSTFFNKLLPKYAQ